jgi:ParB/RepB/Spo0J family partition protein
MNAPTQPEHTQPAQAFEHLRLFELCRSPTNPRRTFDEAKLQEMADSIAKHGVIQPILVRPWPAEQALPTPLDDVSSPLPKFEVIAGERRFRAARLAGLDAIPANIRQLTDNEVLEIQIVENLQREEVHPIEEAEGYQTLMQRTGCSAEELADKVGRSKAYIYARLKLTALCEAGREAFREGKLTASTALLIARIPGEQLQTEAIDAIIDDWHGPLSFRRAAQVIQNHYTLRLGDAPFDIFDADLVPDAGSCAGCPSRSGNHPELFADIEGTDVCTNPDCFQHKREAWAEIKRAAAVAEGKQVITGKDAEKIVPSYSSNLDYIQGGYIALDARCYDVDPVREIPPEPTEPETDDDDSPEWEAYNKAIDEWEDQKDAAQPTYRELLDDDHGDGFAVQHPRTGDMIECAKASDIDAVIEAKGAQPVAQSSGKPFSNDNDRKELDAKAKAETGYRKHLLDQVLSAQLDHPILGLEDLAAIAQGFFDAIWHERRKQIARMLTPEGEEADPDTFKASIPDMPLSSLNRLLLAMALQGEIQVDAWTLGKKDAIALHAAAKRFGVDDKLARKQSDNILNAPKTKKKAKAKGGEA